jgi:Protein of unknown function (DUF3223)
VKYAAVAVLFATAIVTVFHAARALGWGINYITAASIAKTASCFTRLPGDRVTDGDAADLHSLLERHAKRAEKIGTGVAHFEVQTADFNTHCFRVVRKDGTWARFSYPTCISPETSKD